MQIARGRFLKLVSIENLWLHFIKFVEPVRILELFGNEVQIIPPGIRKQPVIECQGYVTRRSRRVLERFLQQLGVSGKQVPCAGGENNQQSKDFCGREHICHARDPFDVVAVNCGEYAGHEACDKRHRLIRRIACRPIRLDQILSKGQRGDGVSGRHEDQKSHPEVQEGRQRAEGDRYVSVVPSWLRDHRSCKKMKENIFILKIRQNLPPKTLRTPKSHSSSHSASLDLINAPLWFVFIKFHLVDLVAVKFELIWQAVPRRSANFKSAIHYRLPERASRSNFAPRIVQKHIKTRFSAE